MSKIYQLAAYIKTCSSSAEDLALLTRTKVFFLYSDSYVEAHKDPSQMCYGVSWSLDLICTSVLFLSPFLWC